MNTFIDGNNILGLLAIMFLVIGFGTWAEQKSWSKRVPAATWVLLGAGLLSNIGIVPYQTVMYGTLADTFVPVAIPLLLFKANIRTIFREGGPTLVAFFIGAIGTLLGVVLAMALVDIGEHSAELAAMYTGTYIGGSLNFVAVAETVNFDNPTLFSAAIAADNVAGSLYLMLLVSMTSWPVLLKWFGRESASATSIDLQASRDGAATSTTSPALPVFNLPHIALAVGLAAFIAWLGNLIAVAVGTPNYGIMFITALTILVANSFPNLMQKLQGEAVTGMLLFYVFFFVLGAGAELELLIGSASKLMVFVTVVLVTHVIVLVAGSALLKISLPEMITGGNACVTGPGPAAAVAASQGWPNLVTPGIMCGVFGYVIATFLGAGIHAFYS